MSASLVAFAIVAQSDPVTAFYLSPLRFWELSAGAILALVPLTGFSRVGRELVGAVGLTLIISTVVLFDPDRHAAWVATIPAVLGSVMLIYAGAEGQPISARILGTRPMVWVGLISYSLYLWHWPIIVAMRHHTGRIDLAPSEMALAILLSFAVAWLSWRFIEQPFRQGRDGTKIARRPMFATLGASAIALIAAGTWVSETDGLPSRMPDEARAAFTAIQDRKVVRRFCPMGETSDPTVCQVEDGPVNVLVWGDSHAMAAWPGIEDALKKRGKNGRLVWLNGCPPLMSAQRQAVPECPEFNKTVLDGIAASNDIEFVVLVARWALAAEGRRIEGEAGKNVVYWDDALAAEGAGMDKNIQVFERTLTKTIDALEEMGMPVVIVGNVPELTFSVPDRLSYAMWKGTERPVGPDADDVRRRHMRVDTVLSAVATEHEVSVLDVTGAMCTDTCDILRDNQPYYYDDDHLSAFGAREVLSPLLSDYMSGR